VGASRHRRRRDDPDLGWVWSGHWLYAGRLRARGDEQGQSERSSRLRLSFFVGVVAVGVGLATTAFGDGLGVLIGAVIGAPRSGAGLPCGMT